MMIYVANPLYDAVFKYMMEDERIAKTLLSALLQKTVIAVEMRRHEYPNIARDAISMFRVDFAATVLEDDGSKNLILIELQKTWLETETLRFRQYLAVQYNNKENMRKETKGKYALPTVAVYLLGWLCLRLTRTGTLREAIRACLGPAAAGALSILTALTLLADGASGFTALICLFTEGVGSRASVMTLAVVTVAALLASIVSRCRYSPSQTRHSPRASCQSARTQRSTWMPSTMWSCCAGWWVWPWMKVT